MRFDPAIAPMPRRRRGPALRGSSTTLRVLDAAVDAWRAPRSAMSAVALLAAWLTAFGNVALWNRLAFIEAGAATIVLIAALLFSFQLGALALTAWGRVAKPIWIGLVAAAAVAQHFMLRFGVLIDPAMIGNAGATNVHEAGDLLGAGFWLDLVWVAALPAWWLWQLPIGTLDLRRVARRVAVVAVASLGVALAIAAAGLPVLVPLVRNHLELRYLPNPVSPIVSAARAALRVRQRPPRITLGIAAGAALGPSHGRADARPPLVLLVVGETARADHFGLNGYRRDTTPELAARGVTSFRDVRSCGTSTNTSLPCMFSPLGRADFTAQSSANGNLLDVVQAAGMAVLWVDNQSGCKGVCDRVPTASTADLAGTAPGARLCSDGECLDEALLEGLDRRIAALPEERRQRGMLVILHQMGSHGPAYGRRSPPALKRFGTECRTLALGECNASELVNAYDHSIVYTDVVLGKTIDWLAGRHARHAPALVYVSDHGESLGEYGVFLHGMPYAIAPNAQTHVPMIAWLGDAIRERDRLDAACLGRGADAPLSHDHLFHTVLGLLDVTSPSYRQSLDVWAACRSAPARSGHDVGARPGRQQPAGCIAE